MPAAPALNQTDEAALRAMIEKLYAHWANKDVESYSGLWSVDSALLNRRREALQKEFTANEKIEVLTLNFARFKIEGNQAEVRVNLTFRLTNRAAKIVTETRHRLLECVLEANTWRIKREVGAEENLAAALAGTPAVTERDALLAANTDLVNETLGIALLDDSQRALSRQQPGRAMLALQLANELGTKIGTPLLVARSQYYVGEFLHTQGDYLGTLNSYQESLRILQAEKYAPGILATLNNIGTVQAELGDYEAALTAFQQSWRLLGTQRDVNLARVLTNLGSVYLSQGNYQQALHHLNQSIELSKSLSDPLRQSIALNSLARLYAEQGDDALAADAYEQALELRKIAKDQIGYADLLSNYGVFQARKGRYDEALKYYQQALESITETDKLRRARILQNIGDLYRRQKQFTAALKSYEESLALREASNSKEGLSFTLHGLAGLHAEQGRYEQAITLIERALSLAREVNNRELLWREYDTAGKIYDLTQKPAAARHAYDESIAVIEELRAQVVGGEQQQAQFFESKLSPFHGVMRILLAQQNLTAALGYAERSKARVLLDVLRGGRADIAKAMTPAEQEKEKVLQREIVSLNTQLYLTSIRKQSDPALVRELQSRLQKSRTNQQAFQAALYAAHPELKVQRGQTLDFDLPQVAGRLLDSQTALLEYVVTDDKTYLFALTQGAAKAGNVNLQLYEIAVDRGKLNTDVEEFRRQLATHEITFAAAAANLYERFVKPAAAQLKGKTKLVIVRDAGLWELPFQALKNEAGRFLIEDFAISYAPSLAALAEMTRVQQNRRQESRTPSVVAFGNPSFGATRGATVPIKVGFAPLPSTETEVNQLAKLYGSAQSKIYLGAEAREERLKAEAGNASVLHLATHGILNDASPMYSQIVLAQPDEKSSEDGMLEAWEVMKLDLQAQVAVLSACETGRGRIGAGEGVIGLTWAFFVAGAPASVVSQWKVDAESTSELMQEFHRNLQSQERKTKAESLRAAELKLLQNPKYRHPFFWASFSLIGEGN